MLTDLFQRTKPEQLNRIENARLRFKASAVRFKAFCVSHSTFDLNIYKTRENAIRMQNRGIQAGTIRNNVQSMPDQLIFAYHGAALHGQSSAQNPELHQMLIWRNTKPQRKTPKTTKNRDFQGYFSSFPIRKATAKLGICRFYTACKPLSATFFCRIFTFLPNHPP